MYVNGVGSLFSSIKKTVTAPLKVAQKISATPLKMISNVPVVNKLIALDPVASKLIGAPSTQKIPPSAPDPAVANFWKKLREIADHYNAQGYTDAQAGEAFKAALASGVPVPSDPAEQMRVGYQLMDNYLAIHYPKSSNVLAPLPQASSSAVATTTSPMIQQALTPSYSPTPDYFSTPNPATPATVNYDQNGQPLTAPSTGLTMQQMLIPGAIVAGGLLWYVMHKKRGRTHVR